MTTAHLVVPHGIDDPTRPSGGNGYDRRVRSGLLGRDWQVQMHVVPGGWPRPGVAARTALRGALWELPDGSVVVIDGLIASAAGDIVERQAARLRVIVLVHLPLGAESDATDDASALEQRALRAASAVIATSAWTRQWLIGRYALDASVVQVAEPGVDPSPVAQCTNNGRRLLCVASVARHKGQDVLVHALSRLTDHTWECLLVGPVGEREFAEELATQVHAAGLSGRIVMQGPLRESVLAETYARSDLLVVPSRLETYGMVVSEALARGMPVVAADVGGLARTMGLASTGLRPGLLVRPDDPDALAAALAQWLDDDVLRRRLRTAARDRRTSLRSWPDTVDQVARIITRAAA